MMKQTQKVLVIDDNPVNLAILDEMLEGEYRVKLSSAGAEALVIAEKFKPDIVLLDVMMPGMDGLEVCRRLLALPDLQPPIIIMVSAKAMPAEKAAGIKAGADDYLTKPFDEVQLLELLRNHNKKKMVTS